MPSNAPEKSIITSGSDVVLRYPGGEQVITDSKLITMPNLFSDGSDANIVVHLTEEQNVAHASYHPVVDIFELSKELSDKCLPLSETEKLTRTAAQIRETEEQRGVYFETIVGHEIGHRAFERTTSNNRTKIATLLLSNRYEPEVKGILDELHTVMPQYRRKFIEARDPNKVASELFAIASFGHMPKLMQAEFYSIKQFQDRPQDKRYLEWAVKLYEKLDQDGFNIWQRLLESPLSHQYRTFRIRQEVRKQLLQISPQT